MTVDPIPRRLSARARRVPADHYIDEVCGRIAMEKEMESTMDNMMVTPSWEGLVELAAEGIACHLDAEARRQRQHLPRMATAVCLPPPQVLRVVRSGKTVPARKKAATGKPVPGIRHPGPWYIESLREQEEAKRAGGERMRDVPQGESRVDELVEQFSDDAGMKVAPISANYLTAARALGATEEEIRDSLRRPRISFELLPPVAQRPPRPLLGPHPKAVSKGRPQLANPIHRSLSRRRIDSIVRREKGVRGVDE